MNLLNLLDFPYQSKRYNKKENKDKWYSKIDLINNLIIIYL